MVTLALLPGMDGTGHLFEPFVSALRQSSVVAIQVVTYPNDQSLDYPALESHARAGLPAEGPLILLGESFSGPIAVSLAANMPDRVIGLILCCTFVRNPYPAFSILRPMVRMLPTTSLPNWLLSYALMGPWSTPALREVLKRAMNTLAPVVMQARIKAVLKVDVSDRLGRLKMPVLYLRASVDTVVPRRSSEWLGDRLPRMKIVEIKAPHFLLQVCPQAAAEVVDAFILELGAQGK